MHIKKCRKKVVYTIGKNSLSLYSLNFVYLIILISFITIIEALGSYLLVIFLEGSQVLTGLGKLPLFHSLPNIPMHEGPFSIHHVELVIDSAEDFGNGRGVGDHANRTLHFGEVSSGHDSRGLVVNPDFESRGAPIDKLNSSFCLNGRNRSIDILGHHISTVHEAASHVSTVSGVALSHHTRGLESR